jgi:thioredoxin reductase (NADPH)
MGTEIQAKVVVIAGGLGCFEPRKPEVAGLTQFENGKGINYMILDPEKVPRTKNDYCWWWR